MPNVALHDLTWQVVDAKEAGAAGVLGTIAQVSVRGAPVLSSFAAALGLDAPVEVPVQAAPVATWMLNESLRLLPCNARHAMLLCCGVRAQLPKGNLLQKCRKWACARRKWMFRDTGSYGCSVLGAR